MANYTSVTEWRADPGRRNLGNVLDEIRHTRALCCTNHPSKYLQQADLQRQSRLLVTCSRALQDRRETRVSSPWHYWEPNLSLTHGSDTPALGVSILSDENVLKWAVMLLVELSKYSQAF